MTRQETSVLLREVRQGSPEALGELYERYGGRLLACIRFKMGRDLRARIESRDILQATLLRSFQRLEQFEGGDGASLMGWLVRIAEHEIRDRVVAAKAVRADRGFAPGLAGYLSEARTLALFHDRRIVQVHELRERRHSRPGESAPVPSRVSR